MRKLWTMRQLAAVLYDWRTELHGLPHHERARRERRDQQEVRRMLRRKGVALMSVGRAIKATTSALRELVPEVWDELEALSLTRGCPRCLSAVECTECAWTSEDEEAA